MCDTSCHKRCWLNDGSRMIEGVETEIAVAAVGLKVSAVEETHMARSNPQQRVDQMICQEIMPFSQFPHKTSKKQEVFQTRRRQKIIM